jgi:hypothetical protein
MLFDLLTSKKYHRPFIRVEKNSFKIGQNGYQKKRNFALISKMCRICVKKFLKIHFFAIFYNSLKNQLICIFFLFAILKTSAHFLNQCKILLLLIPFADYFAEIFFNSYRGRCYFFLKDKRSQRR